MRSPSGRQDSNLRPSAPKALDTLLAALRFRAITNILRGVTLFVLTNNAILRKILVIARKRSSANGVSSALGVLGRRFESCRPGP